MGLPADSYEAYCLDEAVIIFGTTLDNELEQAGHKESKEERKVKAARERVMSKYLDDEDGTPSRGFADPALMFS